MQFTKVAQFSNRGWQKEFSLSNLDPPLLTLYPSASYALDDP